MAVVVHSAAVRQLFSQSGQVGQYMLRLGKRVEAGGKRRCPKDKGTILASFKTSHKLLGNFAVTTVSNDAPHVLYVHGDANETKKRTKPHFPPSSAVAPWASRHGFPNAGGGFLVARAISKKGTPLVPFLKDALEDIKGG